MTTNNSSIQENKTSESIILTPTREEYLSEENYQQEIKKLFHRQWLLVGHTSQVKNNGDYYVKQVGAESMIIARDHTGKLRAYFNVCRHRGYQMMDQNSTGCNSKGFVCPYHQWSYDIDGKLRNVPGSKDGQDFDFNAYPLHEAQIDSFHGWIHIWLGLETPPLLHDVLSPMADEDKLRAFGSEKLKLVHSETYDINANWKSMMENDSECYHCGHGGHQSLAISCSFQEFFLDKFDPERPFPLREGMETFSMDGKRVCKVPLGDNMPNGSSGGYITGPYFDAIGLFCDHAISMELTPVSVNKSLFIVEWWVHEDAIEGQDYNPKKVAEVFHITTLEDKAFGERNYAGMQSSRYQPGPIHPRRENGVIAVHEQIREMMAAD